MCMRLLRHNLDVRPVQASERDRQRSRLRRLAEQWAFVAVLGVASVAWAEEFPRQFRVVCPQLMHIPDDYPDKQILEGICQQLSLRTFTLTHEADAHWRLHPGLDEALGGSSNEGMALELSHEWKPYTCLTAPFAGVCRVPAHTLIRIPGSGAQVQSQHGFILAINLLGVFDLAPVPSCASHAGAACPSPAGRTAQSSLSPILSPESTP